MTADEQIEYERHIAEVIAIRNPKKDKGSAREAWLNSSVLVALIGVVGTGLFGAWISGLIQERAKNAELQRAAQQQRRTDQNAAVLRVLALMANQSSAIDDLLTIIHSSYHEGRFGGQELKDLTEWKKKVRTAHDESDSTWRREKITAGYSLLYLFDNDSRVAAAWSSLAATGDAFEDCANQFYSKNALRGTDRRPAQICDVERKALGDALSQFTGQVAAHRIKAPGGN